MLKRMLMAIAALTASVGCLGVIQTALSPVSSSASPSTIVTTMVINGVVVAGIVAAGWYSLTSLAVAISASLQFLGLPHDALDRGVIRYGAPVLRRAVAMTALATVTLSAPAYAADPHEGRDAMSQEVSQDGKQPQDVSDLGWGHKAGLDSQPQSSTNLTYRVQPGDTLWAIAHQHMDPEASPTEIAQNWPRWYSKNRDVIGPNPNLIQPGMVLKQPPKEES